MPSLDPTAHLRTLRRLTLALATIYAAQVAAQLLVTFLDATYRSPTSGTLIAFVVVFGLLLLPAGFCLFFVLVHQVGLTAEAAGLPLRSSPTDMVWNYFHPIYALFAPAGDLVDVDRFAGGEDVDYEARTPNQPLIHAWWIVRLSWIPIRFCWDVADDASTRSGSVVALTVAFHLAHLLSIAMFLRLHQRLCGVPRREPAWSMTLAQNP